jgi:hypothetical protein
MTRAKIVMGPEELVLDATLYPVTFAALSAIKEYNAAVTEKELWEAKQKRDSKIKEAFEELKGKLK